MNALVDLKDLAFDCKDLAARIRTLCGDDDEAFVDTLDGETDAIEGARRVVRWYREQEANAQACKDLADTYKARAKVFEDRAEGARNALFHLLQYLGQKSMPLPEGTLSIVAGRAKVVGEPDPSALPDSLVRIKREPDKAAIKAALEAGEIVPGCSLSNSPPTLQIRSR